MCGEQAETSNGNAVPVGLRAELAAAQEAAQAAEEEATCLRGRLAAVQEELRVQAACAAAQLQDAKAAQAALNNTLGAQDSAAAQLKQQVPITAKTARLFSFSCVYAQSIASTYDNCLTDDLLM